MQEPQKVVSSIPGLFSQSDLADKEVDKFDVIVCGGTLGIFIATALSSRGLRVGIVEKNILKGVIYEEVLWNWYLSNVLSDVSDESIIGYQREQEWNISRKELWELVEVGILVEDDIEKITAAKFNPVSSQTSSIDICSFYLNRKNKSAIHPWQCISL